jgi:hypothetical protein
MSNEEYTRDREPVPGPADETPPPRRKRWHLILAAVLILICGMIIGSALTVGIVVNRIHHFMHHPGEAPERITRHLDRKLGLTEEQEKAIQRIVSDRHENLSAIREEVFPRIQSEFKAAEAEIRAVLDPEQKREWDTYTEHIRGRWMMPPPPGHRKGRGPHGPHEHE